MATLRKQEMTEKIASELNGSKAEGEAALNAVLGSIQSALSSGDRVVLTGFGSFELRNVKERRVRPDPRQRLLGPHNGAGAQARRVHARG